MRGEFNNKQTKYVPHNYHKKSRYGTQIFNLFDTLYHEFQNQDFMENISDEDIEEI
jgi:hypothetical protein